MHNARLAERAPYNAEVDVLLAGNAEPARCWGGDVSETGIFIQTANLFRVGDRVSLRFDIEDSEVHVRAAEVMWVRPQDAAQAVDKGPGIGVKFVAIDPPARAAIRRYVRPRIGADTILDRGVDFGAARMDDVEGASSWSSLATRTSELLPPRPGIDPLPPPTSSLPPMSDSLLHTARPRVRRIDETQEFISLPPWSTLPSPFAGSEPPGVFMPAPDLTTDKTLAQQFSEELTDPAAVNPFDEPARVFPRPVSLDPRLVREETARLHLAFESAIQSAARVDPLSPSLLEETSPLSGWTFRLVEVQARQEPTLPPELTRPFVDDDPAARPRAAHETILEPSILESVTEQPHAAGIAPTERDRAFLEATVAVRNLPRVAERRQDGRRRTERPLITAAALLIAGASVGAVAGLIHRSWRQDQLPTVASSAPAAEVAVVDPARLRTVLDAEAELRAIAPKDLPPEPAPKSSAATTKSGPASPKPTPAAADPGSVLAPASVASPATAAPPPSPAPKPAQPERLTEAKAERAALPLSGAAAPADPTGGLRADVEVRVEPQFGKLRVHLKHPGQVKRVIALAEPGRIAVDLTGAWLPKHAIDVGAEGVVKVRFGEPETGSQRVALVFEQSERPHKPEARIEGGVLVIRWRP